MLGERFLEEAPIVFQELMKKLQDDVVMDIARRIAKQGQITSSAEYVLSTISEQNIFNRDFKRELQKVLNITDSEMRDLYSRAAEANYIHDKRVFTGEGIPSVSFAENYFVNALATNIYNTTLSSMTNITNSLGFATKVGKITVFQPIARFYQSELDQATTSIAAGTKTLDQAIQDSVIKMANSGLRTVDYASGHHDRIDVAARRAVMGGLRDLVNAQSDYNSQSMGTTVFEISWHGGYRPSHKWGGRRFDTLGKFYPTEEELYLKHHAPDGTTGTLNDYNCYHEKYAVFPDTPTKYTDEQLDQMHEEQLKKIPYEGKSYNAYEARQQQRYLERVMRRQHTLIKGYEGAVKGGDFPSIVEQLKSAKTKMRVLRTQYRDFSEAMGLTTEFERVYAGL